MTASLNRIANYIEAIWKISGKLYTESNLFFNYFTELLFSLVAFCLDIISNLHTFLKTSPNNSCTFSSRFTNCTSLALFVLLLCPSCIVYIYISFASLKINWRLSAAYQIFLRIFWRKIYLFSNNYHLITIMKSIYLTLGSKIFYIDM